MFKCITMQSTLGALRNGFLRNVNTFLFSLNLIVLAIYTHIIYYIYYIIYIYIYIYIYIRATLIYIIYVLYFHYKNFVYCIYYQIRNLLHVNLIFRQKLGVGDRFYF